MMGARGLLTAAAAVVAIGLTATPVGAAGDAIDIPDQTWSFAGVFGTFDRAELQRGFQVYQEVCAGCHSLNHVSAIDHSLSLQEICFLLSFSVRLNLTGLLWSLPCGSVDH